MIVYVCTCIRTRARVYAARDKQRQCIASAVRKIFLAVAPFSSPTSLPAIPASRKIRHRKTDTSRSKVRILFPGTLLPRVFSSQSPAAWAVFYLSPPLSFLFPAVSLISRLTSLLALSARRRNHASKL